MNPADPADAIAHLAPKLRPILSRARELGAFINFDMESYAHKNITPGLLKPTLPEEELKACPDAGMVIHVFLRRPESILRSLSAWGAQAGSSFQVRRVK